VTQRERREFLISRLLEEQPRYAKIKIPVETGEFHFPGEKAVQIAVEMVMEFKGTNRSRIEVVFNVFKDIDYEIYRKLLAKN